MSRAAAHGALWHATSVNQRIPCAIPRALQRVACRPISELRARAPFRSVGQNTHLRGTPARRRDVAQEDLEVRRVTWVEDSLASYCERTGENPPRRIQVLALRLFNDRHFKEDVRERARTPVRHLELQHCRILDFPRWRRVEPNLRNLEGDTFAGVSSQVEGERKEPPRRPVVTATVHDGFRACQRTLSYPRPGQRCRPQCCSASSSCLPQV